MKTKKDTTPYFPPRKDGELWEYFHENSKNSEFKAFAPPESIQEEMHKVKTIKTIDEQDKFHLPTPMIKAGQDVLTTILHRSSKTTFGKANISLKQLSTLLYYTYGERPTVASQEFPSPRMVPSASRNYPLELFFYHHEGIEGLKSGIWKYHPKGHFLSLCKSNVSKEELSVGLFQPDLIDAAPVVFFITSLFFYMTTKYRDRGYRFTLLEAGHLAQNLNLVATALNFTTLNIGGYHDNVIDEILDLDGLFQSTIYLTLLGMKNN